MEDRDDSFLLGLGQNQVAFIHHCAYCHRSLREMEVRRCAKCHRRPYCGRECQALDWKSKKRSPNKDGGGGGSSTTGLGQGHKDWCGLLVCEEDADWELVPIEGKGEGLVARTLIPPLTRIVVDGAQGKGQEGHYLGEDGRARFVNHNCDANANRAVDLDYQVHIIYSKRAIQPGEEITVNYLTFTESPEPCSYQSSSSNYRQFLQERWGIVCPPTCFCRSSGLDKLVENWKLGFGSIRSAEEAIRPDACAYEHEVDMDLIAAALRGNEAVRGNPMTRARLLEKGFEVAVRTERTLEKGMEYIQECAGILGEVVHPRSRVVVGMRESYLKDPGTCKGYLCIDKKWVG